MRRASASARSWRARRRVPADVIVPVPDSGVPAAMGYAVESGIPFELGIIRNHYVGRTFIEPSDRIRHLGVKLKHSANRAVMEGKRVILVDDSIVRGTTSRKIVEMVREAGAKEVHMRISSPPTTHLLLRHRHARAQRAAGGQQLCRGDGRLSAPTAWPLSRSMALSRAWQFGTRPGAATLLRRVLHRRLSDRAARSGGQR